MRATIALLLMTSVAHADDKCATERSEAIHRKDHHDSADNIARAERDLKECLDDAAKAEAVTKNENEATSEATKKRQAFIDSKDGYRLFLSAGLCMSQRDKRSKLAQIAKERHYSSVGGVVDLEAMNGLQEDLKGIDGDIAGWQRGIGEKKIKPVACSDKRIKDALCWIDGREGCPAKAKDLADVVTWQIGEWSK